MVVDATSQDDAGLPAVGTLAEALLDWEAYGYPWPVSGDASAVLYGAAR